MKTLTTQPTQSPIDFPQTQPIMDPTIAVLLYLSVLFPLVNQNLQHLVQLLTSIQTLRKALKRNRPNQKPKK